MPTRDDRNYSISRFRVHKGKTRYWWLRYRLGGVNDVLRKMESAGGSQPLAIERLKGYRRTLLGQLRGYEETYKQFGIDLDRTEAPLVTDDDIRRVEEAEAAEA